MGFGEEEGSAGAASHLDVAVNLALGVHVGQATRETRANPRNLLLRQRLLQRAEDVG